MKSLEYSSTLMSCRETLYSTLSKSKSLQNLLRVSHRSARAIECRVLLSSSALNRCHGALQSALSTATYLSQMVKPCLEIGLKIDAAVHFEGANVLWEQEELSASIRMLQDIQQGTDLRSQDVQIGKSELLAKLVSNDHGLRKLTTARSFIFRVIEFQKRVWKSLTRSFQITCLPP